MAEWRGKAHDFALATIHLAHPPANDDERRNQLLELIKGIQAIDAKAIQLPFDVVLWAPRGRDLDLLRRQVVATVGDLVAIELRARPLRETAVSPATRPPPGSGRLAGHLVPDRVGKRPDGAAVLVRRLHFLIGQSQILESTGGFLACILVAFALVFLYQFAVLPRITDFPILMIVLGAALIPLGILMAMSMAGMLIIALLFSFLALQTPTALISRKVCRHSPPASSACSSPWWRSGCVPTTTRGRLAPPRRRCPPRRGRCRARLAAPGSRAVSLARPLSPVALFSRRGAGGGR